MGDNTDADVKKVAAAAISAAKEDTKAATAISAAKEDTKASTNEDTKADAKEDTNDTNDTNDTKEDTNDANDANDANDTTDANDANDATDADDTTDAKDGDVEKKPNKRSVGQQERRERERQAKDTNNRNIVKEKLLGNIKKSQFVGNAINPKMQGLHGFFETFLKNTNKELKEGEKEKKTDILKLFGDTNLLASINKLDISIKKNFKTFIFNSMNDISEFFLIKTIKQKQMNMIKHIL